MEAKVIIDELVFPEGPRWRDGALVFSDMHAGTVQRWDGATCQTLARVPGRPSGLGWLPDGRLLVVSMEEQRVLRLEADGLVEHANLAGLVRSLANDMVVADDGGAFVSNFGFDVLAGEPWRSTTLVHVDAAGRARVVADGLMFPNGMVLADGGRTLVVAEPPKCCLTAFDVGPDGSLTNRREWAALPGLPDGICLDEEGCIWVALSIGGTFEEQQPSATVRVREGGDVLARVPTCDGFDTYACALGGDDGRMLFLMEARSPGPEALAPGNGRIRALQVDVAAAGSP